MITRRPFPAMYHLSYVPGAQPGILLSMAEHMLDEYLVPADLPIVRKLQEEFDLPDFQSESGGDYGYGGCIKRLAVKDEYAQFFIPIPVVDSLTDEDCRMCGGTGTHVHYPDEECHSCRGRCKEKNMDWTTPRSISATLTLMTISMWIVESTGSEDKPQLMMFKVGCHPGSDGSPVYAAFSSQLVGWLSLQERGSITEMAEAMKSVWHHMFPFDTGLMFRMEANIDGEGGWLNINVPGNSSGLNPDSGSIRVGEGYCLRPHNVDNPMQQLTLLTGLAALEGLARKDIG